MNSQNIPRIEVCQNYTDKACLVSLQKAIVILEMTSQSIFTPLLLQDNFTDGKSSR